MLLESALELFGAKGFHATSVQEIVKAAGLTKGAFYHHFASKEDVLRLIHDEFLEVQVGLVEEILESYDSPVDQLRALVRISVLSVTRYQAHVAVFFQERRYLTGERGADVKRRRDAVEEKMEQIVRRGIESGDFDPSVDPRIAVFGIVGMTAWVHQWYRAGGPLPAETIADKLASMTLDGVLQRPPNDSAGRNGGTIQTG
jgi:AcrR family transcriptional regulator